MSNNITNPPKFSPKLTLVIGNKNYSSWSLRPWLAMAAKNIPFAEVLIPLQHANTRQQILQYAPSGKVPILKYGNLIVWESLAIIECVADMHPEAGLWPEEPEFRAIARSLAAEVHAGYAAFRAQCPMNLRRSMATPLSPATKAEIIHLLETWKRVRADIGSTGPFLFGDFGAVDAMFAPLATRLRSYEIPVDRASSHYIDAIYALPAFQQWYKAAVAEPWKIEATDYVDKPRPTR